MSARWHYTELECRLVEAQPLKTAGVRLSEEFMTILQQMRVLNAAGVSQQRIALHIRKAWIGSADEARRAGQ